MQTLAENLHEEHKASNAIQKTSSNETTPFIHKEIFFSKVLTTHIQLVQNELNHREVNYYSKEKITIIKSKLRQNEIAAKMRIYEQKWYICMS